MQPLGNTWPENHICLNERELEDPEYGIFEPGYYFLDEVKISHGPFSTREEALALLLRYIYHPESEELKKK